MPCVKNYTTQHNIYAELGASSLCPQLCFIIIIASKHQAWFFNAAWWFVVYGSSETLFLI